MSERITAPTFLLRGDGLDHYVLRLIGNGFAPDLLDGDLVIQKADSGAAGDFVLSIEPGVLTLLEAPGPCAGVVTGIMRRYEPLVEEVAA